MIRSSKRRPRGRLAAEALRIMAENQVDELPVVDEEFHPVGTIDIQDLLKVGLVLSTQPKRPRQTNEAQGHDRKT